MDVRMSLPPGQQEARNRWNTQESGAAFDRKKSTYLTEDTRDFIAQRSFCVLAGLGRQNELDGLLVMGSPGSIQTPDTHACLLRLDASLCASPLFQRLSQFSSSEPMVQLGLFFISHATRERLCVQGRAEPLVGNILKRSHVPAPLTSLWVLVHVQQAFFHCAKYIRTKVPGLNIGTIMNQEWCLQDVRSRSQPYLSEEICAFIEQQVLCFICTRDQHGHCAVNHRGGASGFLISMPPDVEAPGGRIMLPDYAGNGAFEAIGNILETGHATFVVPCYPAHMALRISGRASIMELAEIPEDVANRCVGAERVVALSVQRVTLQDGDWSETLAYERRFAASLSAAEKAVAVCPIQ